MWISSVLFIDSSAAGRLGGFHLVPAGNNVKILCGLTFVLSRPLRGGVAES